MATNTQKAQIHILKDDLCLSRENYEALLSRYGVNSSADRRFTQTKANQLIRTMRGMVKRQAAGKEGRTAVDTGWGKTKYEYLRPRPARMADPRQLRKIEAIWRDAARNKGDAALTMFLARQCGKKNIIWLTKDDARAVLCALEQLAVSNEE
jgi:hypothetical protein